jgi:hypothetical protein
MESVIRNEIYFYTGINVLKTCCITGLYPSLKVSLSRAALTHARSKLAQASPGLLISFHPPSAFSEGLRQ